MKNPSKLHKLLRKLMEKAILEYRMIEKGDRVLVGISGGADSLVMLHLLVERRQYLDPDFNIAAVHIDLGFRQKKENRQKLEKLFHDLDIQYRIVPTQISAQAFARDATKNPCFICSHHRRRKIYETAHQLECNKIAYGHHKNDIIETLLLNILYSRKIEAMNPVQEVFKGKIYIIRPLTYVYENLIKKLSAEINLPVLESGCPADGNTRRDKVKAIIENLQREEKKANIKENIFKSLQHVDISFKP